MPLMMDDAKRKMGVSDQVTNFAIPLGITFNKVGTIIYIGVLYVIDILCDMPKTLLNVYSVSCGTLIVARSEGDELQDLQ